MTITDLKAWQAFNAPRKVYDPETGIYCGCIYQSGDQWIAEDRDAEQQPHASEADAERALLGQDVLEVAA